jgi:hypothetical protein
MIKYLWTETKNHAENRDASAGRTHELMHAEHDLLQGRGRGGVRTGDGDLS